MTTITQVISTAPTAPSWQRPDDFPEEADSFVLHISNMDTELNTWAGQVNTVAGEINTVAGEINTIASTTIPALISDAENAKTAAENARDLSLAYSQSVATLVEGTINDSVVSTTTTFSSSKIKQMIITYTYDDRDNLRSLTPNNNEIAIVDGLGFFVFKAGSDEPDDDESCFATASGKWLLEAVHWDVVDAWQLPDDSVRDEFDEDTETDLNTLETDLNTLESKFLYGTATCAITSVSATTSTAFTGTVTGASIGDRVYVNPPAMLGSDAANTSRLSYHAYISATDTVTIQLCNASASSATVNSAVQTTWKVIVIKE